jgi:hypothetical protein
MRTRKMDHEVPALPEGVGSEQIGWGGLDELKLRCGSTFMIVLKHVYFQSCGGVLRRPRRLD